MGNFTEIIKLVQDTANNLIGFMNLLVPLLMTLMIYTGNITTKWCFRANYFIYNKFYRKYDTKHNNTTCYSFYKFNNNIKNIRRGTSHQDC